MGVRGVLAARCEPLLFSQTMKGEEIITIDAVQRHFMQRAQAPLNAVDRTIREEAESVILGKPRLGTYGANMKEIREIWGDLAAWGDMGPVQRRSRALRPASAKLMMTNILMPGVATSVKSLDQQLLMRRGVMVQLGIREYQLRTGRLPADLSELAGGDVGEASEWLVDPYSGGPLVYKLVDPATDAAGRSYLLYSVGADGVDNGGNEGDVSWIRALQPGSVNLDANINDPIE